MLGYAVAWGCCPKGLWGLFDGTVPWIFGILFGLWLASFMIIEGFILVSAFTKEVPSADWLIVLGSGVRGDKPSPVLRTRLDRAAEYLQIHPDTRAAVSGGRSRAGSFPEAEVMERYLVQHGIASERILREDQSTSTLENLRNSSALIAAHTSGKPSLAAVTSEFHRFRVKMLARRLDLPIAVITTPSPRYVFPNQCLREYFAVIKSVLLDH